MKAIRIAALGVALMAGGSVVASAQGAPPAGAPGRGNRPDPRMANIELSAEQRVKIEEIQKKYSPEMQVIRDLMQGGGDRAEGMKKMNDLRMKMSPEIRALLTADQQAVYDKNAADMKARMEAMAKPPAI